MRKLLGVCFVFASLTGCIQESIMDDDEVVDTSESELKACSNCIDIRTICLDGCDAACGDDKCFWTCSRNCPS